MHYQSIDSNIDFNGYYTDINGINNLPSSVRHGNSFFAINWEGIIKAPATGWVNFYASHDDGARLMINDEYIYNNWRPQGSIYYNSSGQYYMEEGKMYDFQAEMFENGGGDVMRLFWQYDSTSIHIINSDFFFHTSAEIVNYVGYGNILNNTMKGNDNGGVLYGMEGNDTLIGGAGADTLYGGNGSDIFVFNSVSTVEDTIMDWMVEDKIDFSEITNNVNYIGDKQFSGTEGELRFNAETQNLELDVDADTLSDININVVGYSSTVTASHFSASTFE